MFQQSWQDPFAPGVLPSQSLCVCFLWIDVRDFADRVVVMVCRFSKRLHQSMCHFVLCYKVHVVTDFIWLKKDEKNILKAFTMNFICI